MGSIYTFKVTLLIFCLVPFWVGLSTNLSADNFSNNEYTIGPEDILEITVWDNKDLDRNIEISQDGSFTFPFIGTINADGLSIFELETLIEKKLGDGYILAPQVTIKVTNYQSQKAFLFGEVRNPGSYVIKRKTHILELISKAGGFTDRAARTIKIVRHKSLQRSNGFVAPNGNEENEVFTLDLNKYDYKNTQGSFAVVSGDHIYVEEELRFFITGEVGKRGEFKWEEGLTVRLAISLAGGTTQLAAEKRTRIIRVKDGKGEEFKVGMDDMVMPDDVIKVPTSHF